jgi:hypothetical protein
MQLVRRIATQAISNGRLAVEASYPATVSVTFDGGMRLQFGNNRFDVGAMGSALLRQMPVWTP